MLDVVDRHLAGFILDAVVGREVTVGLAINLQSVLAYLDIRIIAGYCGLRLFRRGIAS